MQKISPEQAKILIEKVQEADIVAFFEKVREYGILDAHLSQFQKEFVDKGYSYDFSERLQDYIDLLANGKTQTFPVQKYAPYLGLALLLAIFLIWQPWNTEEYGEESTDEIVEETSINEMEEGKTEHEEEPKKPENYTEIFTINGKTYEFEMIWVEGGRFEMGSEEEEAEDIEQPIHTVELDGFHMTKYEVTQELYEAVMGENPSYHEDCPQCPVEMVSWHDTVAFLEKLEKTTGKSYRLPTEAEWEYAARGGQKSKGYEYAGASNIDEVAWYWKNSGGNRLDGEWEENKIINNNCKTYPVGQKQANELGLYDMSGNVWDWCSDWYAEDYYSKSTSKNPTGATGGSNRVLRGGSWRSSAEACRITYRNCYTPGLHNRSYGFRFVL